jgi:hypothetical protein
LRDFGQLVETNHDATVRRLAAVRPELADA